jgi:hypothetical protein
VVAVDVGSVSAAGGGRYAWAALDLAVAAKACFAGAGRSPDGTAKAVLEALAEGTPVAVGWEAPGTLPVPGPAAWRELGQGRQGEGNRAWSAGAGAGALCTGLAQSAWLCRAVKEAAGPVLATCDPARWTRQGGLLLWEAFVSGTGKPTPMLDGLTGQPVSQHEADAEAAAAAFDLLWQTGALGLEDSAVTTGVHRPLNLLVAGALAAGLAIDVQELSAPLLVLKTSVPAAERAS